MSFQADEKTGVHDTKDDGVSHSEILVDKDLMTNALDAENREHQMTPWQAAKLHPKACFWAFIMCFTIVRSPK